MAISKVEYNNNGTVETLIDLTSDTVTSKALLQGYTAHCKNGKLITGNYNPNPSSADVIKDYVCGTAVSIVVPEGVNSIRDYVFYNCTQALSITIPEGVTSIGKNAFYYAGHSATSGYIYLVLPSTLLTIESNAFNNAKVKTVTFPENLKYIGGYAFFETPIQDVDLTLSGSGTDNYIGSCAFQSCKSLQTVKISGNCYQIYTAAFQYCTNLTTVDLSEATISYIQKSAFSQCTSLQTITIPDSVYSIYDYAFSGCTALQSAVIGSGVHSIGSQYGGTFQSCTSLTTVTFNSTPTTIMSGTFTNCSALTDIYVPWAEGEVANAPWGATNATIHYNTTT